jgi:hypothetical protein
MRSNITPSNLVEMLRNGSAPSLLIEESEMQTYSLYWTLVYDLKGNALAPESNSKEILHPLSHFPRKNPTFHSMKQKQPLSPDRRAPDAVS